MLDKAKELARAQFIGRTDKMGVDYFTGHLSAVAGLVSSDEEKTVAYLHDILEDTDYSEEKLREEFGDRITDAVVLMTHREKLDENEYLDYIRYLKNSRNELAIAVKIADLTNNSDYTRLGIDSPEELQPRDRKRWEKYQKSLEILKKPMKSMRGMRTLENDDFCNYFEMIQNEAKKQSCIFFADSGEGHQLLMDGIECEDLSGWLIPEEKADEFEKHFLENNVSGEWDNQYYCCAEWSLENGAIKIIFNDYGKIWMDW